MADNHITLILEGVQRDDRHVRFEVFLQELQRLKSVLSRLDSISTKGQRNSHFAVVGLSHSSPACVELEHRPNRGRPDVSGFIYSTFEKIYGSIESNQITDDIDFKLLTDFKRLADPVGSTLNSAIIKINGSEFPLTEAIAKNIQIHMSEYEECPGSIEGMLEKINVHEEANIFTVYPDVGPASVACHFPKELLDKAFAAGKRKVSVSGVLRYRKTAPFPHQVAVETIDIYPDAEQLATFQDLFGIAPYATGQLSSEDFIKELRCGWQ